MAIGYLPPPRIIGQPDDAAFGIARRLHPLRVQAIVGVGGYSESAGHVTQVLRGAMTGGAR
jgi:hypothetical protein